MLRSGWIHLRSTAVKRAGSAIDSTKRYAPLRPGSLTLCNRQKGGVSHRFNKETCSAPAGFTYGLQPSRGRGQPSIQQRDMLRSGRVHLPSATVKRAGSAIDSIKRHAPLRLGSLTVYSRQKGGVIHRFNEETCSAPAEFTYSLQPSRGRSQPLIQERDMLRFSRVCLQPAIVKRAEVSHRFNKETCSVSAE